MESSSRAADTSSAKKPAANGLRIRVIHGPNLNLLGRREPHIYGNTSLAELDAQLERAGQRLQMFVDCRQANGEGQLIDLIHQSHAEYHGIVINPAGYSHTSIAIADALRSVDLPAIEVHMSNLYAREPDRHRSIVGAACLGVIMGLGKRSYTLALEHLADLLNTSKPAAPAS